MAFSLAALAADVSGEFAPGMSFISSLLFDLCIQRPLNKTAKTVDNEEYELKKKIDLEIRQPLPSLSPEQNMNWFSNDLLLSGE